MTTEEKIRKLSNAVTDWRGKFHPVSKAWIVRPKPGAIGRVAKWLAKLGREPRTDIPRIQAFQKFEEFHDYLREVRHDIATRILPTKVVE